MNLYIGNLAYETSEAELREAFAAFGTVKAARVIYDRDTGRSRGFGFVEMEDRAQGQAAMTALNGTTFHGRLLKINEANARPER